MQKRGQPVRTTLKDISRECNVSTTAISLVLKGVETKRVGSEKRDEIIRTAKRLNYRPNYMARALVGRESSTIGLVLDTLAIPFYAEIAQNIIAHAKSLGYSLLVSSGLETSGSHEDRIDDERQAILNLIDRGVEGIIICSALRDDPVITEIEVIGVPIVLALREVKRGPKDPALDYVGTDNERGGYIMGEHILKMGHKRIAIVTGDMEASSAHDRLSGTLTAFKDYGVEVDQSLIVNGGYRRSLSYHVTNELLEGGKNTTAIIAHSDIMAMGVLQALKDHGIRVPKDMAVVGLDNSEMAGLPGIDLTTVAQERSVLGKMAADMLIDKIRNPRQHLAKRTILNPTLVIRKTCGYDEWSKTKRP